VFLKTDGHYPEKPKKYDDEPGGAGKSLSANVLRLYDSPPFTAVFSATYPFSGNF